MASKQIKESCKVDFFILHIGSNDQACLHFIRLLEQEGYSCCSNLVRVPNILLADEVAKMINKSRNYIIWISSQNEKDNEWSMFFEKNVQWTAIERHGYFLPYIFRLNNCPVPEYLKKYEKYETYELSTDFTCKMAEILEYLKRSPTKGVPPQHVVIPPQYKKFVSITISTELQFVMTNFTFSERSVDYIHKVMYTYDVYVAEYECGRSLRNFLTVFENYRYRVYCPGRDGIPGETLADSIISNMRKSKSFFVLFDNTFFDNKAAIFEVEEGKQIKHGNQNFKLIVVELMSIPSKYLNYVKLFSRITIQNNYEERAYQQISKIINETGLLLLRHKRSIHSSNAEATTTIVVKDLTEEEIEVENCRLKNLNEQIAIAREVNMLPPQKLLSECRKGIHLYKRLVESTSEEIYYIRVVVLGQEGVGKTTLVKRLLQENISQVESTNGIEINVDKCGISLHNGKWVFQRDLFSTNGNAILLRKLTEMKGYKQLRNEITNEKMEKEKKVVSQFRNFERSVRSFVESENERVKNEAWKQSLQDLTVENSFDYGKTAIMSVWDFAGQQEYYPTHQLFLSKNCIVLLVSDISKGLHQKSSQETVLYECNPKRKQEQILSDVNDYVQYWTNTVHCYGDVSRNEDNLLNPPIIPVATHIDSIQHSKAEDYIDEYQEALLKSLGSDRRKDHFRNFFAISNTQSSEAEIEKLRQYIFAIAKQQEHWGVKVPVKWIPFGNKIEDLRLKGRTVVTVNDLWGINTSLPSPLSTKKELMSFLVLHHDIGNIIFFEDIGESVIICLQWFANALRCVVGAKCFKAPSLHIDWEQYENTGFLQKKLIEHLFKETESSLSEFKEHIFNVMEKYDILVCADILDQEYDMYNNDFNYLVPCMVRTSGWQIISNKFVNFTKSAIICFEYNFLPSMFFVMW